MCRQAAAQGQGSNNVDSVTHTRTATPAFAIKQADILKLAALVAEPQQANLARQLHCVRLQVWCRNHNSWR